MNTEAKEPAQISDASEAEVFSMGGSDMGGPDSLVSTHEHESESEPESKTDAGMGVVGEMVARPE